MIKDIPILKLANGEIRSLFLDAESSSLLVGTTDGNIIKLNKIYNNIYGTGNRDISSVIVDGFGNQSEVFHQILTYAMAKQLIRASPDTTPEIVTGQINAYAAFEKREISGSFISPILWAGNDFGYWEKISLQQSCPSGCETEFFIRTGESAELLGENDWISMYHGSINSVDIPIGASGNYVQLKITLNTNNKSFKPIIYNTMLSYRTKHAVYFFTSKFVLEKDTNAKLGIFTATYTLADSTEIQFGISEKISGDWNDYVPVETNKLIDIPAEMKDRFKIGIKLVSHQVNSVATVEDFVFSFDGEKKSRSSDIIAGGV